MDLCSEIWIKQEDEKNESEKKQLFIGSSYIPDFYIIRKSNLCDSKYMG